MEDFQGMYRDTIRSKTPPMMWEFARNILLSKNFKGITHEDGFDFKHLIPGQCIGTINTNEDIVYFSVDGAFSCIGYFKTNINPPVYIPVIRSIYLGFKLNRPIEGIFFYNFNKELIISFCDGIFEDSNLPRLINCTNIGVPLTGGLELVDPTSIDTLNLNISSLIGDINITYEPNGAFEGEIAYITYAYILDDKVTATAFFPIHTVAYPTMGIRREDKRNIIVTLTKLDPLYSNLKIGILVKTATALLAYESTTKSYNGTTYITTLNSLAGYNTISTDSLVIPTTVYTRIKTMTAINSEIVIGNLVSEPTIAFQKYANLLRLALRFDTREEQHHNHPILCPDEVYSFVISLLKDGTYTEEFHIPGEVSNPIHNETSLLTSADLALLGIEDLIPPNSSIKKFRIFNTGGFASPFNVQSKHWSFPEAVLNWGYWENVETYPNNTEYDSTLDYANLPIVGGVDLRNTPIRYHRVPGLDNLVKNFPCVLGYNSINTEELVARNSIGNFQGAVPAFAVFVTNFDTVVPLSIRSQIQGYKISIVKRTAGNRLVEDINFLKQATTLETTNDRIHIFTKLPNLRFPYEYSYSQFGFGVLRSTLLAIHKPNINAVLVKANYGIKVNLLSSGSIDTKSSSFTGSLGRINWFAIDGDVPGFTLIPDTQRFAVIKDITYLPGNNLAANTSLVEDLILFKAHNTLALQRPNNDFPHIPTRWNPLLMNIPLDPDDSDTINMTLKGFQVGTGYLDFYYQYDQGHNPYEVEISTTFINLIDNVYSGFSPKEFITLGQVTLRNTVDDLYLPNLILRNIGDVFTNNIYNILLTIISFDFELVVSTQYFQHVIKGMISVDNNSEVYSLNDRNNDTPIEIAPTLNYSFIIYNKEVFRSLNDLIVGIAFDINKVTVNYFPYRIHRSLKLANENLSSTNIRTFLSNNYKEMLNDRGEIIALRGSNKTLYIQQKYSLFVATIKDKLTNDNSVTYLGEGDIFDRTPDEVMDASNKGYLGCTSQFASVLYRDGYVVVDQVKGNIYIISSQGIKDISRSGLNTYFNENYNTFDPYFTLDRFGNKQHLDNPFTQIGHNIGFDERYNRLLFTKKFFKFTEILGGIEPTYTFDGEYYYKTLDDITTKLEYTDTDYFEEVSTTFSYSLDGNSWVCEHDYFPNAYVYTNLGLYTIHSTPNSSLYKHNSLLNKGNFYGTIFESFVDLMFNSRPDLSKLYQSISWSTQVTGVNNENYYFKTIDAIRVYNDFQATQEIDIPDNTFGISRNLEGIWNFNSFRDVVTNKNLPIISKEGRIQETNININRSWFEKSNFIYTFIVVRMIMKNLENNTISIQNVNVKSRISDR